MTAPADERSTKVSLASVRYAGLAGSMALGAGACLAGAFPTLPVHVTPQIIATGPHGVLIIALWVLGTAALAGAWWLGRRMVTTVRWVVATAALWTLPMLLAPPFGSRDVYAYACQGALFDAGRDSYHEGVSALPCPWIDSVSLIWRDTPTPYGTSFIMLTGAAARLGSLTAAIVAFRVLAVVGVALIGVSLVLIARRIGLPVDRTLWLVLASPVVVIHLVGGAHNDALTIGLLTASVAVIACWWGRAYGLAIGGVLLGLSVSFKPTMLVAIPFIVLYASGGADAPPSRVASGHASAPGQAGMPDDPDARHRGWFGLPSIAALVSRGGPVFLGVLAGLGVPTVVSGLGFGWVYALLHAGGGYSWTSVSTATGTAIDGLSRLIGAPLHVVSATRTIGIYALVVALVLIFWRTRQDNRLYGAGMALLAVSFFAPFTEPWYLIWPLAMFAMTAARMRWFAAVVVASCFTAMPDGVNLDSLARLPLSIAMTGVGAWAVVCGVRWLRGRQPTEIDLVARSQSIPA